MSSTRRVTRKITLPLAAAFAAVLVAAAPAPRFVDGYVITMKVTSEEGATNGTITAKIAGGQVRMELDGMTQGPQAFIGDGYVLLREDGRLAVVLPDMRQVMVIDASTLASGMSAIGGPARPQGAEPTVNIVELGAGERILGYATRKYRVTTSAAPPMAGRGQGRGGQGGDQGRVQGRMQGGDQGRGQGRGGMGEAARGESTSEVWLAPDIVALDPGFEKFASSFAGLISGGTGGGSGAAAKMPKGFALKSVVFSGGTDASSRRVIATTEVTDITRMSFDASEFDLPVGFPVMDIGALMGQMRGRGGN